MGVFLIAYDIVKEKKNAKHEYDALWAELKRLKAHRTQYSLWLINVALSAKELHDHFRKYLDENDLLWTTRVLRNEYHFTALKGTVAWLEVNSPESR